jgi:hypothetical protein
VEQVLVVAQEAIEERLSVVLVWLTFVGIGLHLEEVQQVPQADSLETGWLVKEKLVVVLQPVFDFPDLPLAPEPHWL